ncbi:MAG: hypothetical protein QM753_05560 [Thermomicrobiales bacterium]
MASRKSGPNPMRPMTGEDDVDALPGNGRDGAREAAVPGRAERELAWAGTRQGAACAWRCLVGWRGFERVGTVHRLASVGDRHRAGAM